MLPLMIDVKNRLVVIIGGGKIAYRRLSVFLKQGAKIKVISPHVIDEISFLHAQSQLEWKQKEADKEDFNDAFLIVAATDSKEVNAWVARRRENISLSILLVSQSLEMFRFLRFISVVD
ncbi:hypothetical protein MGI18_12355 [Bacillus sp. OVS6]|nr:hypothetical protein MGI18_12355 [Bacillus sp. OVS6]